MTISTLSGALAKPTPDAPTRNETLIALSRSELATRLRELGVPERQSRMRVRQLWSWLYVRGATDFAVMTDIAKELRGELAQVFTLARPEIVTEQVSVDGTRKWLLRLADGKEIETVYIPEEDRGTLCISSQVGCTLTCSFCHTGTQRLVRNLTPSEIVGQIMLARDRLGDWPGAAAPDPRGLPDAERKITNVVLMGMGEPLYNFEHVRDACAVAADGEGLAIGKRRITLSTSGVAPEIPRWGEEAGTMLAISLHAVRDELRDQLVPINKKWPLKDLLGACRAYPGLSNAKRITFEYVMLKGVNDFDCRREGAGAAARQDPRQDQSDPVQSVARRALRMLGLGADREIRRGRESRRLCEPGAHPARPGHHGGLRAAQEREREAARQRPVGPASLSALSPGEGGFQAVVAPEQFIANDERRRAE